MKPRIEPQVVIDLVEQYIKAQSERGRREALRQREARERTSE